MIILFLCCFSTMLLARACFDNITPAIIVIEKNTLFLCDTFSDKMAVKPEVFFEFTGKHRGSNGSIYVLFYDKNGKGLPNATVTTYADGSSIWRSFKISGVIPPGTVNAAILLRSWSTSKQLLFDDLKFVSEK